MKKCNKCGQMKPLSEYARGAHTPDGHTCTCKTCFSAYVKARRKPIAERRRLAEEHKTIFKTCVVCGEHKHIDDFPFALPRVNGEKQAECKFCKQRARLARNNAVVLERNLKLYPDKKLGDELEFRGHKVTYN